MLLTIIAQENAVQNYSKYNRAKLKQEASVVDQQIYHWLFGSELYC